MATDRQLAAAGFGGDNALPIFAAIQGDEVLFATGFDGGDPLVRASGPDFSRLDAEIIPGQTPAPDTGNPFRIVPDFGFNGEGAYFLGASRRTEPDGPLQAGVYTRTQPDDSLATFINLDSGLPSLPQKYEFDGSPRLSAFVIGGGGDAGVYLNNNGFGVSRLAEPGDGFVNVSGVTAEFFSGPRFTLDGRTITTVVDGSDNRSHLTEVTPGNGGELRSLLASGAVVTDDAGDRLEVRGFANLVASDRRTVVRLRVEDLDAPFNDNEREALASFENGVLSVFARTDGRFEQFGVGLSNTESGLATEGDLTVFNRTGEDADGNSTEAVFVYDGTSVDRLFGVGDAFGGGTLLDVDFGSRGFDGERLAFTAVYTDAAGDTRVGLFTATVPEPAGLTALLVGAAALVRRRRLA